VELDGEGIPEEPAAHLADLAKELMRVGLVSRRVLMEVSEGEFLEWAGLVVAYAGGFRKREIQKNTRHFYTQRKFNLLREESEGYAKLVTLLNQAGAGAVAEESADAVVSPPPPSWPPCGRARSALARSGQRVLRVSSPKHPPARPPPPAVPIAHCRCSWARPGR